MKKDFYYDAVAKAKDMANTDIWAFIQHVVIACFMYEAGRVLTYYQVGFLKVAGAGTWYYGDDETYHRGTGVQFFLPKTVEAMKLDESKCFYNLFDCMNTEQLLADVFEDVGYWSKMKVYSELPMFREFINAIAMQHSAAG